jgi:hypothetical protein
MGLSSLGNLVQKPFNLSTREDVTRDTAETTQSFRGNVPYVLIGMADKNLKGHENWACKACQIALT